jgi:acid phosphatase family membrane protein YuiD
MESLKYLIAIAVAWAVAQGVKSVIYTVRNKEFRLSYLSESGGMPSAHSAFVVSFTTLLGLSDGIYSPLFALSVVVAVVVIYDAMKVRYAVGEQAIAFNSLLKEQKSKANSVRVVRGHRLEEVVVGVGLGVLVALATYLIV